MASKTNRLRRIGPALKKATIWAVKTPIIKVHFITSVEKAFIEDANRFLEPSAIKPEYRKKKD